MEREQIDADTVTWLPAAESEVIVSRWKEEFGAERYETLVAVAPESGAVRDTLLPGVRPSWLAPVTKPVFVLFQEYKTAGLMTCEWLFVAANLIPLARVDGNGFVAATRNWTGVMVVDLEEEDGETVFAIEAWGVFVRR
ncbi:hypothetical protein [Amycolatopsis taiwanensis]|uniref:Uncharacterized protein n=1 Tax=Amycolatopsis taiwanensis TaxID=342230 RepID=A0A9W6VHA7_9PSEU|nr:hypothetical protein [Amycolatopsis taiwanensis]GLY71723.1 hypothetical protein Atai01_83420 [Amycolatopsis taiwanensis]